MKESNPFIDGMKEAFPRPARGFWQSAARVTVGVTIVAFWVIVPVMGLFAYLFFTDDYEDYDTENFEETAQCNVYAERIHGALDIYTQPSSDDGYVVVGSDDIVFNIEAAANDDSVKGVLLDIDSPGGSPVAADEVAKALQALDKPSVAVIHGYGDSAAYWAATGADVIFASPISDVGSIGVTQSYLENVEYNTKEGFMYQQLSVGKYKDAGDPDKPLTPEEKQLAMKQLEFIYDYFVNVVATNRDIPVADVKKIATGQSFLGGEALKLKLIDQLGGLPEATTWLEKQIGAKPEFCW